LDFPKENQAQKSGGQSQNNATKKKGIFDFGSGLISCSFHKIFHNLFDSFYFVNMLNAWPRYPESFVSAFEGGLFYGFHASECNQHFYEFLQLSILFHHPAQKLALVPTLCT
jgi:hypothetical protein